MTTINNVKPTTAEELFDLLKKEFATYVDEKIDSALDIEYAHVSDIINISFPEVREGLAFTLIVTEQEITVETSAESSDYDLTLLHEHLINFLTEKCE
ncbi:MAG: hypothetical protein ABIP95_05040 [Pelobium sp.]